ncbi:hypothetical protein PAHAL_7G152900 [Panicum hallii]|uniref:Uncharacterized protein n=1 Tax=Panicum hallii TaxID=206008 RepID=A0A2T8ICE7_9POAL|nr:hypothetical protein PAHAL_7G152900 [Panicum hallii]
MDLKCWRPDAAADQTHAVAAPPTGHSGQQNMPLEDPWTCGQHRRWWCGAAAA